MKDKNAQIQKRFVAESRDVLFGFSIFGLNLCWRFLSISSQCYGQILRSKRKTLLIWPKNDIYPLVLQISSFLSMQAKRKAEGFVFRVCRIEHSTLSPLFPEH